MDMNLTREPSGNLNSFRTEAPARTKSTYYYLTDAIGTTRAVVDDQGEKVNAYDYSPRGVTRAMTEKKSPAPPLRGRLPGPDRPLPQRSPVPGPPHGPLHPARPVRPGDQSVPVRLRRPAAPRPWAVRQSASPVPGRLVKPPPVSSNGASADT
ncbi:hypothetical protein GCM10010245_47560 [Streptomyces spectabilis]|nr:hypothetical protein GCM10010245_47560 [Streptomyces spectabilis]